MKELYSALAKFQGEVSNIELNADVSVATKTGGKYTFQYATLGQIRDAIRKPLADNGLAVLQTSTIQEGQTVWTTIIIHSSGQSLESSLPFSGKWNTAQEFGSLITYYRRYGLVTALGLVAEDDDDANVAVGNTFEKKATEKKNTSLKPTGKVTDELIEQWKKTGIFQLDKGISKSTGKPFFAVDSYGTRYFLPSIEYYNELQKYVKAPE